MKNKKLKEKKIKAKEKLKKEQKNKQRLFLARQKRAEKEAYLETKKNQEKQEPIRNESKLDQIKSNIEHNLEILKALEEEYIANQKQKADLNSELEAEGFTTIEEKIESIKKKSEELVLEIQRKVEAEEVSPEVAESLMPVDFKNKKK